jgi:hypothetical protein
MTRNHTPRRRLFAVTIEMDYGATIGRPVTRVLHIEAATPEAAAQKVSQLAGVGGFIESIRPMSEQWLPL